MSRKQPTVDNRPILTKKQIYTYWMTRDSDPDTGAVSAEVSIWLSPPKRESLGRGCFWMADRPSPGLDDLWGTWSAGDCLYHAKTYPDDDRQSIRVGPLEDVRPVLASTTKPGDVGPS